MKYISIKMDPNGRIPPTRTITQGSMNHFFSGIGLGTAFILREFQVKNKRTKKVQYSGDQVLNRCCENCFAQKKRGSSWNFRNTNAISRDVVIKCKT